MRYKKLPHKQEIAKDFYFDAETGLLHHAVDKHCVKAGDSVTSKSNSRGKVYYRVFWKGSGWLVHRLVWKLHYGSDPVGQIDHINGNTLDNRIENMRDVDCVTNQLNRKKVNTNNKTAIRGVHWTGSGFRATKPRINNPNKSNYLTSGSLLDCAAARISLENKLGIAA